MTLKALVFALFAVGAGSEEPTLDRVVFCSPIVASELVEGRADFVVISELVVGENGKPKEVRHLKSIEGSTPSTTVSAAGGYQASPKDRWSKLLYAGNTRPGGHLSASRRASTTSRRSVSNGRCRGRAQQSKTRRANNV